jgi:phosphatidate cytidylyltransferase
VAKLGNLASRFLVAAVAAPVLIFIIYLDRPEYTWALVFAATLLAMYEFFAMTLDDRGDRWASMLCGAAAAAAMYWLQPMTLYMLPPEGYSPSARVTLASLGPIIVIVLAVIPISLYYLFRFRDMATVAARFAYSITGIVYVALTLTFLSLIKRDFGPHGADMVIFVLLVVWLGDTGAYFAGRFLGKKKLYPAVSPKKTWAGAFGGLALSAVAAAGVKLALIDSLPWVHAMGMALPGAALGQMGDLVESLFKRSTGVKDSGAILPGHGGILDRVDAVLFFSPYVYLYLMLLPAL